MGCSSEFCYNTNLSKEVKKEGRKRKERRDVESSLRQAACLTRWGCPALRKSKEVKKNKLSIR